MFVGLVPLFWYLLLVQGHDRAAPCPWGLEGPDLSLHAHVLIRLLGRLLLSFPAPLTLVGAAGMAVRPIYGLSLPHEVVYHVLFWILVY